MGHATFNNNKKLKGGGGCPANWTSKATPPPVIDIKEWVEGGMTLTERKTLKQLRFTKQNINSAHSSHVLVHFVIISCFIEDVNI